MIFLRGSSPVTPVCDWDMRIDKPPVTSDWAACRRMSRSAQDIEVELDYNRSFAITMSRRTRVSFSIGIVVTLEKRHWGQRIHPKTGRGFT